METYEPCSEQLSPSRLSPCMKSEKSKRKKRLNFAEYTSKSPVSDSTS